MVNEQQQHFISLAQQGKNVFLTGNAGTGKTYALAEMIRQFEEDTDVEIKCLNYLDAKAQLDLTIGGFLAGQFKQNLLTKYLMSGESVIRIPRKRVFVVAPTGMAAANLIDRGIPATTIHRFFGWDVDVDFLEESGHNPFSGQVQDIPFDDDDTPNDVILVIDEISMVDAWMFRAMEHNMREKLQNKLFGGAQVIMCGDYGQLPPVITEEILPPAGFEKRNTPVPITQTFKRLEAANVRLEECMRADADDPEVNEWCKFLDTMRISPSEVLYEVMNIRPKDPDENDLVLCYMNRTADEHNRAIISELPGNGAALREKVFGALPRNMKRTVIDLKVGCNVVVTANQGDLYNGYRGVFNVEGDVEGGRITVDDKPLRRVCRTNIIGLIRKLEKQTPTEKMLSRGKRMQESIHSEIAMEDLPRWASNICQSEDETVIAAFGHPDFYLALIWPILPGYAITVHKSQGMTLKSAHISKDVGYSFAPPALAYVAVSRVRGFSGLTRDRMKKFSIPDNPIVRLIDTLTV